MKNEITMSEKSFENVVKLGFLEALDFMRKNPDISRSVDYADLRDKAMADAAEKIKKVFPMSWRNVLDT